jgi:hypothetical protein
VIAGEASHAPALQASANRRPSLCGLRFQVRPVDVARSPVDQRPPFKDHREKKRIQKNLPLSHFEFLAAIPFTAACVPVLVFAQAIDLVRLKYEDGQIRQLGEEEGAGCATTCGFAVLDAGGPRHASDISALAGPSLHGDSVRTLQLTYAGRWGGGDRFATQHTKHFSIPLAQGPPLGLFAEYLYRVGARDE